MKAKKKVVASPSESARGNKSEAKSNVVESTSEEEHLRRLRRERKPSNNSNDLRVDISEFEAKLNPEEFLD